MKICVIGLGYIGLPTATIFAQKGLEVLGVDTNPTIVDTINQAKTHIIEPELDKLVFESVKKGFLKASLKPDYADVFIICVPTPFKQNHQPNIEYIQQASKAIAKYLQKGNLVLLESTSPCGTTEKISHYLSTIREDLKFPHNNKQADIFVAYTPERVLPGSILKELVENDRIIGGITTQCTKKAIELYKIFVKGECIPTDAKTAEMTKLTENAFRDVNIAFANELSLICEEAGIDVYTLIKLANHHPRVNILKPSCGVGGHCIAVDPWFIISDFPKQSKLIKTAREVNDYKTHFVTQKITHRLLQKDYKKIAILGLSFKPDIDDLRESPAMKIAKTIITDAKREILIVEPHIKHLPQELSYPNVRLCTLKESLDESQLIIILVAHKAFLNLNIPTQEILDFVNIREV